MITQNFDSVCNVQANDCLTRCSGVKSDYGYRLSVLLNIRKQGLNGWAYVVRAACLLGRGALMVLIAGQGWTWQGFPIWPTLGYRTARQGAA